MLETTFISQPVVSSFLSDENNNVPQQNTQIIPTTQMMPTTMLETTTQMMPTTQIMPTTMLETTTQMQPTTQMMPTTMLETTTQMMPTTMLETTTQMMPTTMLETTTFMQPTTQMVETTTFMQPTTQMVEPTTQIQTPLETNVTTLLQTQLKTLENEIKTNNVETSKPQSVLDKVSNFLGLQNKSQENTTQVATNSLLQTENVQTNVIQPTTQKVNTSLSYLLNNCDNNNLVGGYDSGKNVLFELDGIQNVCINQQIPTYNNNNVSLDNANKMRNNLSNLNNENNSDNQYQNLVEGFDNRQRIRKPKKCSNKKMKWIQDNFYCILSLLLLVLMVIYKDEILRWLNE
jgi:hypothetical protein